MANAKTTTKKTVKSAAKKADAAVNAALANSDGAFKHAEDFTASARGHVENFYSQMTDMSEDWRETAEDVAGEIQTRVSRQQEVASELGQHMVDAARTEMSDAVQFANELTQAKTFADALEIQQNYFTSLFERRIERSREMTERTVEVTKEAMSPMNADFGSFFSARPFDAFFRAASKA